MMGEFDIKLASFQKDLADIYKFRTSQKALNKRIHSMLSEFQENQELANQELKKNLLKTQKESRIEIAFDPALLKREIKSIKDKLKGRDFDELTEKIQVAREDIRSLVNITQNLQASQMIPANIKKNHKILPANSEMNKSLDSTDFRNALPTKNGIKNGGGEDADIKFELISFKAQHESLFSKVELVNDRIKQLDVSS